MRSIILTMVPCLTLAHPSAAAEQPSAARVALAEKGRALVPVVVADKPSKRVRNAAKTLADYLDRISGGTFVVVPGDGQAGIAIGLPEDFPKLKLQNLWDARDPSRREDYLLRSHGKGLLAIGATDLAVEYAVWDLLYRLGHRQFFPGELWEIVPPTADLAVTVDALEHPAFLTRDVGYGYGPWDGRGQSYVEWSARNRMGGGSSDRPLLEAGHSYDKIYSDLKKEFDKHPEYLALVKGKRQTTGEIKFCISNPGLRKLVAEYAVDHFARNPTAASMSLEPSDGLGWCECEKCRGLGSVSDRVITLINEAAAAVRARHGRQKLISTYAYAEHAPPPTIKVNPLVVVCVATAMTSGDYSTDELVDGWRKQGARLGIREYYGVFPWDHDLPGKCRLADLEYLRQSIPRFYQQGARFLIAESSDNWGVAGLGYYLMARMLWDVREANRVEALKDDFLDKAFGSARKPMAEFYRLIDAAGSPRISSDLIGRMYRALGDAKKKSADPAARTRIDHLILYTRYVELFADYAYAESKERQRAFEELLRFTYRIRHTGMIHALAVWRGLPYEDPSVKLPPGGGYDVPEGKDPWKENRPVHPPEIESILTAGMARNRLIDFTPVTYSTNLRPAWPLALPEAPLGDAGLYFRNQAAFYIWTSESPGSLPLKVKAGLIYQHVGNVKLSLSRIGATTRVDRTSVAPDQKPHAVNLQMNTAGLHKVEVSDRSGGTALSWPEGKPWTIPAGPAEATDLYGRWNLYFYVPKGTKVVAGHAEGPGELLDGNGKKVFTFAARPDYFSVPVATGQDGRLWKFTNSLGRRILLTVPPYLARAASELLLPEEAVRADTPK